MVVVSYSALDLYPVEVVYLFHYSFSLDAKIFIYFRYVIGVKQIHTIIQELQQIAKDSGQERPLMIGIDQENGIAFI